MSYDLNFWKYTKEPGDNHLATYKALCEGQTPDDLESIPVEQMLNAVSSKFKAIGWTQSESDPLSWESDRGAAFQLGVSDRWLRVDCYGLTGEEMNEFIDIAAEFSLPLYDPQVNQRFILES